MRIARAPIAAHLDARYNEPPIELILCEGDGDGGRQFTGP